MMHQAKEDSSHDIEKHLYPLPLLSYRLRYRYRLPALTIQWYYNEQSSIRSNEQFKQH
jgi:hypothetical protein